MKYLTTILSFLLGLISIAQELNVKLTKPFEESVGIEKTDLNGYPCALVKIQNLNESSRFEGNVIDYEYISSEYHIFMSEGSKFLRIKPAGSMAPVLVNFEDLGIDGLKSDCVYTIKIEESEAPTQGIIDGHEWVDLGLPSGQRWATCNVGASSPYEDGMYLAWGEVQEPKNGKFTEKKCRLDNKTKVEDIGSDPKYDAASAHWGDSWRMPTQEEWIELFENCTLSWSNDELKKGWILTGKNGQTIFFKANGYALDINHGIYRYEYEGNYWSSTPVDVKSEKFLRFFPYHSWCIELTYDDLYNKGKYRFIPASRYVGRAIRPIAK